MKVTEVPAQIVLADGEIERLAGEAAFTVMVTELDVAGLPLTQLLRLEVNTQVITSPFTGAYEYVAPVPTLVPFFFH